MDAKTLDPQTQIRAWKDPKFRASLDAAAVAAHPAGTRLAEVDDVELSGVWGGVQGPLIPSEGHVCSISGECSESGQSCWII